MRVPLVGKFSGKIVRIKLIQYQCFGEFDYWRTFLEYEPANQTMSQNTSKDGRKNERKYHQ